MQRDHDKRNPGFFDEITSLGAMTGVIMLALLVLALISPSASEWISAAVQAEFVGSGTVATPPTQIGQPLRPTRIVKSN